MNVHCSKLVGDARSTTPHGSGDEVPADLALIVAGDYLMQVAGAARRPRQ